MEGLWKDLKKTFVTCNCHTKRVLRLTISSAHYLKQLDNYSHLVSSLSASRLFSKLSLVTDDVGQSAVIRKLALFVRGGLQIYLQISLYCMLLILMYFKFHMNTFQILIY